MANQGIYGIFNAPTQLETASDVYQKFLQNQANTTEKQAQAEYYKGRSEYYPLEAQANINRTKAEEERVRGENFRYNPGYQVEQLANILRTKDPSSPEYAYADRVLGQLIGGQGSSIGGTTGGGVVPGLKIDANSAVSGVGQTPYGTTTDGVSLNPYSGGRYGTGKQIAFTNADGSQTSYTSQTPASTSNLQNRVIAGSAADTFIPVVNTGIKPYQGVVGGPLVGVTEDVYKAQNGDKAAKERLTNLMLAFKATPEAAGSTLRMQGIEGGEANLNAQKHALIGNLVGMQGLIESIIPNDIKNAATDLYLPLQKKSIEAEQKVGAQGFPIQLDGQPYFEKLQQPQMTWTQIAEQKLQQRKASMTGVGGAPQQPPAQPQQGAIGGQQQPPLSGLSNDQLMALAAQQGIK